MWSVLGKFQGNVEVRNLSQKENIYQTLYIIKYIKQKYINLYVNIIISNKNVSTLVSSLCL